MKLPAFTRHYLIIGVLLLYFAVRLFNLDALPLFIDETLIIQRSQQTVAGSPLGFGTQGKYLLPWLLAFFAPGQVAWWIPRVVMLLLSMIGAVALVTMARRLHSAYAGVLALALLILTPMLHFHERLVLADTALTSLLTLYILSLLWLFDTPKHKIKVNFVAGLIYILSLLAKASAIVILPLAVLAALILPKAWSVRERLWGLFCHYGIIIIIWMPLQVLLWWRKIDYFGRAAQGSATDTLLSFDRILQNSSFVLEGYIAYWGLYVLLLILVSIIGLLFFRLRYGFFFLSFIAAYTLALILFGGSPLYYRYWLAPAPILLLTVTLFSLYLAEHLQQRFNIRYMSVIVPAIVLLSWLNLGIPFIYTAAFHPTDLALPRLDRIQYIEADSAGTKLPDLAHWLNEADPLPILGAFPQCDTLAFYLQKEITCLNISGTANQRQQRFNQTLQNLPSSFYLILERPGYIMAEDLSTISKNLVRSFERPGGIITIEVYQANH